MVNDSDLGPAVGFISVVVKNWWCYISPAKLREGDNKNGRGQLVPKFFPEG